MSARPGSHSRRGAMLVQMGLVLMALFGFVALAVDTGNFYIQQAELQVTASAAAAGAALELPDESAATSAAMQLAEANLPAAAHGNVLPSSGVEFGFWNNDDETFTAGGTPVNAVRVTTRKTAANGNPGNWIVASLFGFSSLDLAASATAKRLPALPGAVAATGDITIGGNAMVDSYDSSLGSYDGQTPGDDGDIITDGNISISGSAEINGDVQGGTVSSGGSSTVSGSTSEPRRPLDLPPVDTTEVEQNNDNDSLPPDGKGGPLDADRNFTLSGNTDYTIPAGTYYFNDMTITGQSSLTVEGKTIIYLTGDLSTAGGDLINSTQDPNNLQIYMTGGTALLNASVDWYGLLYAPNTDVTVSGSGDIYGAIIGANVDFTGTGDIHFDSSLSVDDGTLNLSKRSTIVQ